MHPKLNAQSNAALSQLKPGDELEGFTLVRGVFDEPKRKELASLGIHLHLETGPVTTCRFLAKNLDGLLDLEYVAAVQFQLSEGQE